LFRTRTDYSGRREPSVLVTERARSIDDYARLKVGEFVVLLSGLIEAARRNLRAICTRRRANSLCRKAVLE